MRKKKRKLTGIIISPYTMVETGDGGRRKGGSAGRYLALLLYFFLFFLGMGEAFCSMVRIPVIFWQMGGVCMGASILFTFSAFYLKKKGIFYLATGAALAAFGFMGRDALVYGCKIIANRIIQEINRYYSGSLTMYSVNDRDTQAATLSLCYVLLVFMWIVFLILSYWAKKWLLGILAVYLIWAGLLIGRVPSARSMGLLLVAYCGLASVLSLENLPLEGKQRALNGGALTAKVGGVTGILVAVVLLVISFGVSPVVAPRIMKYHKAVFEAANRLERQILTGKFENLNLFNKISLPFYSSSGMLDNREIQYSGEEQLEVTLEEKPANDVYLRSFVGDDYMGSRWNRVSGKDDAKSHGIQNIAFENLKRVSQDNLDLREQQIKVKRLHADGTYFYVPYYSNITKSMVTQGDGGIYGKNKKEQQFQGFFSDYQVLGELSQLYTSGETEEKYREYVKKQYLKVPEGALSRLKEECGQQTFSDVEDITAYIRDILHGNASYSLKLDKLPPGEDFVEYFLYQQKKGYCIHFATTATLMYRIMGVPARYVTGYIVPSSDFQYNEAQDSCTAVVKDDKSHAWVEIYLDGKGWMPVEMTPGYVPSEDGQDLERPPDTQQAEEKQPVPESTEENGIRQEEKQGQGAEEEADGEGDTSQGGGLAQKLGKTASKILSYTVTGLILLACLLVIILGRRWFVVSQRLKLFGGRNLNGAIVRISRSLYQMLTERGYEKGEHMSDLEWASYVQGSLSCLKDQELLHFVARAQDAAYGRERMQRQDVIDARRLYRKINRYLYKGLKGWKKLQWKYLKCH